VGLSATVQVSDGNGGYQTSVPAENFAANAPISDAKGTVASFLGWTYDAGQSPSPIGGQVSAKVPGIQITTVPTRFKSDGTPDLDSPVIVTLGAASCSSKSSS
jgi:hypothetical protein